MEPAERRENSPYSLIGQNDVTGQATSFFNKYGARAQRVAMATYQNAYAVRMLSLVVCVAGRCDDLSTSKGTVTGFRFQVPSSCVLRLQAPSLIRLSDAENVPPGPGEKRTRRRSQECAQASLQDFVAVKKKPRGCPFKAGSDDRRRVPLVAKPPEPATNTEGESEPCADSLPSSSRRSHLSDAELCERLLGVLVESWLAEMSKSDLGLVQVLLFCHGLRNGKGVVRAAKFAAELTGSGWQGIYVRDGG